MYYLCIYSLLLLPADLNITQTQSRIQNPSVALAAPSRKGEFFFQKPVPRDQGERKEKWPFYLLFSAVLENPSRVSCSDGQQKEAEHQPKPKQKSKPPILVSYFPVNFRLSLL